MSSRRRVSLHDDLSLIQAPSEARFEEFYRRFRTTIQRFNLDTSFSFSENLNSVVSNSTTYSDMSNTNNSSVNDNDLQGDGVEGDVPEAHAVDRTEELAARIERGMIDNQVRLFQQMDMFMVNVIKKLENLQISAPIQNTSPREHLLSAGVADARSSEAFQPTPRPRNSISPSMTSASESCRLDRWNIKYDGTDNVSDFLFKVDRLQSSSSYTDEQVTANFHTLLSGRPNKWFWGFLRRNPTAKLSEVKEAMTKEFGRLESDVEIYMRLLTRKQGFKESFDDFYNSIVGLNDRLKEPFDSRKLMDVIRNNAKDKIGEILLSAEVKNLEQLRNKAREAERFLAKRTSSQRTVHEIEVNGDQSDLDQEGEEVAAIFPSRKPVSTSSYICWNCDQKGHAYHFCPSHIRNLFCFLCGAKGVNTVECGKHSGNSTRDERKSGEIRSLKNKPDHSQN